MTLRELIEKILEKKVDLDTQVYTREFRPNQAPTFEPIEDIFVEGDKWVIE